MAEAAAARRDWLRLTLLPGIGGETQRALLKAFGAPQAALSVSPAQWERVLGAAFARRLGEALADPTLEARIKQADDWLAEPGNHLLTLGDAAYPQALLNLPDPPTVLYLKGRSELLNRPAIAIVGSRSATVQGERDAAAFARELAAAGLTVVSGLALGIDSAAHRGALEQAGGTVAVIGTGADRLYPARNAELGRAIATRGALLSEFPLATPALAANFPRRNRLIAGLALGTLVVEAAPRSGSLITARLAAETGREVFAIPGSIHSPQSRGCHQLIRQGAKLVETVTDILEELHAELQRFDLPAWPTDAATAKLGAGETAPNEDSEQEQVLTLLAAGPCNLDTLTQLSGLTPAALLAILLSLELAGRVAPLPGGLYQRLH